MKITCNISGTGLYEPDRVQTYSWTAFKNCPRICPHPAQCHQDNDITKQYNLERKRILDTEMFTRCVFVILTHDNKTDVTLSKKLALLKKLCYSIHEAYCCFCRHLTLSFSVGTNRHNIL